MANYPTPSWLGPQAALGWGALAGEAARARATQEIERDRLAQQSAQFAIEANQRAQQFAIKSQQRAQQLNEEMKARQDALNYQHLIQNQKIAIDQAYKQQRLGLDEQRTDIARKNFDARATEAAKKYSAIQAYQKRYETNMLPKEKGGKGMDSHHAAIDASQELIPYMTPDAIAKLGAASDSFQLGPPVPIPGVPGKELLQTGPNRSQVIQAPPNNLTPPITQSVTNSAGTYLGDRITFPDTGKEVWKPHSSAKGSQSSAMEEIKAMVAERLGKGKPSAPATAYKTKDDVVSAYKKGNISRDQASQILHDQFGVPLK